MPDQAAELLPVLITQRLKLRCFRVSDAPALAANLTPAVTRWLATWPDPVSVELAAERIELARASVAAGWHVSYAIERMSDGVVIGGFGGGTADDGADLIDVGYHLAEHAHGQGYMTEAGRAALAAMWRLLPVQVIEAVAQRENAASFGVMRKLGMSPIGQRLVHSPARDRWEWCGVQAINRPA